MTTAENVTTDELRIGDVIRTHGMRLLIDGPIDTYDDNGRTVYRTDALLTNADEITDNAFLVHFTKRADGARRWIIQGNDLAGWLRELP
jgi:hypothetical protein